MNGNIEWLNKYFQLRLDCSQPDKFLSKSLIRDVDNMNFNK